VIDLVGMIEQGIVI